VGTVARPIGLGKSLPLTSADLAVCSIPLAVLATWWARRVSLKLHFFSYPNPLVASHQKPVPYLGGFGVLIGVLPLCWRCPDIAIPATAYFLLGLADDARRLAPLPKFAAQLIVAFGAVLLGPDHLLPHTGVDSVMSVWWVLTLVNAYNFVDVCDGLAAGLAAITLSCLSMLSPEYALVAIAGAGSCVGFLVFNVPPARIYLGDAGSQLLGFLVAVTSLGIFRKGVWPYTAQGLLATSVPLFELIFITAVRVAKGLPFWRGSPDHFALRMQRAGLTPLGVDLIAWFVAALFACAALAMSWVPALCGDAVVAGSLLIFFLSAGLLLHIEKEARN
jgi:UDP-GlcNAc:undecaprenyl-phosphate GlcNAc-1-phosphate transferase